MKITCSCGQAHEVAAELVGQQFNCVACGAFLEAAPPIVVRPIVPHAHGRKPYVHRTVSRPDWDFSLAIKISAIIAGFLGFSSTFGTPPSPLVLIHYLSLVAMIVGAILTARHLWPQKASWCTFGGVAIGILLVVWYSHNDHYSERWTNDYGDEFMDTYKRGGQLVDRHIWFKSGGFAHGPMAGEGHPRPHGKWTHLTDRELLYFFYWYGEEVSEGEWHLRSGR